jgi:hypothetical protein
MGYAREGMNLAIACTTSHPRGVTKSTISVGNEMRQNLAPLHVLVFHSSVPVKSDGDLFHFCAMPVREGGVGMTVRMWLEQIS